MTNANPNFNQQVQRLYDLSVYGRWLFVGVCWVILGSYGIWGLRDEFVLWRQYITWTSLRYGLAYNIIPTSCLVFCVAITAAVLVWQSRNILYGLPMREKLRLENQVKKIHNTGPSHPLWKWVIQDK